MDRFLTRCAQYIFEKHAHELQDICIVLPNRRSGVFFYSYLQKFISEAVIAPYIITVDEFISGYSELQKGEKLELISVLYKVFKKHTDTGESFDDFYFWGEVLLSDFNDIDQYTVNAEDIFTNISEIKEIESLFEYLTEEQREAILRFWNCIGQVDKKRNHQKFVSLWKKLYPVYRDFKIALHNEGIAYTGMIYRQAVEKLEKGQLDFRFEKYYIIGLNALNNCEKIIFSYLKQQQKAKFLWDYHHYYVDDAKNEAGKFTREDLRLFPPPDEFRLDHNSFEKNKNIKLVAVPSNYGQAQEIPLFLAGINYGANEAFDSTAIILADESLVFPALSALPANIGTVNLTMGYQLKNSVVYGFLLLLINLLMNRKRIDDKRTVAYHRFVTDILNHQLLSKIEKEKVNAFIQKLKEDNRLNIPLDKIDFSPMHKLIFSLPGRVEDYSAYFFGILMRLYDMIKVVEPNNRLLPELIYSLFQAVEKLDAVIGNVIKDQGVEIGEMIYFRLFKQYVGQVSVAFEGEPLSGIQVMGILETRCLDFKNIIILGLNENKWPRTYSSPSFIPYNIRKGFGLPAIDEQDAMYAYYFYRLIQRAENITATYSTLKEGLSTGELSRYGYQLMYGSKLDVETGHLNFSFSNDPVAPITVRNSQTKIRSLTERNSKERPLSPTAINTFLKCSLKFYFHYILQLPEPEEMKDEIDSPVFGNIFHEVTECLYGPFSGKQILQSDIKEMLKNNALINDEILKAILKHYYKYKKRDYGDEPIKLGGKTVLIYENIKTFVRKLLEIDAQLTPFELVALENSYSAKLTVDCEKVPVDIYIGGKIDRVDKLGNTLRVLDYKTGSVESFSFNEVGELFERDKEKQKKEILQALIYCFILKENMGDTYYYQPVIYSLKKFFDMNFSPIVKFGKEFFSFQDVEKEFVGYLKILISEILDSRTEFRQTTDENFCRYCSYNKICRRY